MSETAAEKICIVGRVGYIVCRILLVLLAIAMVGVLVSVGVIAKLPEGFAFENAHWHFDQVEDSLSILWCRGYDTVSVQAVLLLDSNTGVQQNTDVLPDEITPQAMEQRFGRYVDDDLGDTRLLHRPLFSKRGAHGGCHL